MKAIVAEDGDPLREKFELKTLHEEIDAKLAESASGAEQLLKNN
ncbi:hypothetical protein [Rummeliibacillus sp. G93]|nr:hypothetical protein [Rummeliibacillus sp. G93]